MAEIDSIEKQVRNELIFFSETITNFMQSHPDELWQMAYATCLEKAWEINKAFAMHKVEHPWVEFELNVTLFGYTGSETDWDGVELEVKKDGDICKITFSTNEYTLDVTLSPSPPNIHAGMGIAAAAA